MIMRKKKHKKHISVGLWRNSVVTTAILLLLGPGVALAAPAEYGVIVDLGIVRTDNIFLANSGLEESETIFTVAPEFFLMKDSERLNANLRYRPQGVFYSDLDDADDVFHILDASLTTALAKDRFFLDLKAANFQSIVTPDGQFPTSNLPITGNRVDSRTFEVSPYWRQRLGQASLLVKAGYRDAEYDSSLYQAHNERYALFQLNNIESQQGFAWGVDYQFRRMEYEISTPWEFQRAGLNLGFWVNSGTRIFVVGGAETSFDDILTPNMDEDFWEAGFQYKPNQRMDLELAVGERSYGTSFRGNFSYTLRRGNISITYDESPSTRGDLSFDRRPITSTDGLDGILDQPGLSDRFVRRRAELNTSITLSKSDLTLRIFSEEREKRTTADGVALEDESLSGAAIRWSWNLGTKTVLGLGGDISERDQFGRRDDLLRAGVDLAYNFSDRLSIRFEGMHSSQNAKENNTFDYDENQIRVMLRTEF